MTDEPKKKFKKKKEWKEKIAEALTLPCKIQQVETFIHSIHFINLYHFHFCICVVLDAGRTHPTKAENDFVSHTILTRTFFSRRSLNLRVDSIARRGRKCVSCTYTYLYDANIYYMYVQYFDGVARALDIYFYFISSLSYT